MSVYPRPPTVLTRQLQFVPLRRANPTTAAQYVFLTIVSDNCNVLLRDLSVMNTHSAPFIFNLPNEVLREIISFIPGDHIFCYQTIDGETELAIQILVLMSVSRRFRMIALEADFWTSQMEDFNFDSLLPNRPLNHPPESYEDAQSWLLATNRFKALIRNASISSRLGAKIRWTFSTFFLLDLAIVDIPHFRETVREITLDMTEIKSLGQLSLCPSITKLTLSEQVECITLNQIHLSCPLLEELVVLCRLNKCFGTLKDLSNLRSLTVHAQGPNLKHPTRFLPIRSSSTLTYLELVGFEISPEAKQPFSIFTSLTDLSLSPLTANFCDVIAELSTKLTSFSSEIPEVTSLPKVIRMLSSESLRRLTTLKLHISPFACESANTYKQYSYSVLQIITVALPSLEVFHTQMYIEEDGCQMFGQCRSLKKLSLLLGREEDSIERTAQIIELIREGFDGLEEKPSISVDYEFVL